MDNNEDIQKIIDSLSQNERKILPYLKEKNISEISKKSQLNAVSVMRALGYLQNKDIVKLLSEKKQIVEIGVNGARYKKNGLPERNLVHLLSEKRILVLKEAQKLSQLSDDEFKAAIGALKKKAMIEIKNEKIILKANTPEITKKMLEENFIEALPLEFEKLQPEQIYAFQSLKNRRDIIQLKEEKIIIFEITDFGKKITALDIKEEKLIEQLTPEIIKISAWKGKKFRRYDVSLEVPKIYSGKRHFVNQAIDYAKRIWTDTGFEEMEGEIINESFWNFDALFTPQDHPARELQDSIFLDRKSEIKEKELLKKIKEMHENGAGISKGWQYKWDVSKAEKLVMRTHTTVLSAKTLYKLKDKKGKFFAIGRNFRNEAVDWSHGFEFNQTEGIVIDPNANFRHLLGYLKEFFKKMGFPKARFRPAYFPYTEPSVEIDVFHPIHKKWIELGGAGIFRPEVVVPLLGKDIPVLAWGPGFDRIIMDYYDIHDIRELYKNDIKKLREIKMWMR